MTAAKSSVSENKRNKVQQRRIGVYSNTSEVEISPEVLTNSLLFVLLDIPSERNAVLDISLRKVWPFLPK